MQSTLDKSTILPALRQCAVRMIGFKELDPWFVSFYVMVVQ